MKEKKLRVAPLIRVSTEKQATQGESLLTQRQQIEVAVSQIGGFIPEYCESKYSGQEHGTRDFERKMMDQLLEDSSNDFLMQLWLQTSLVGVGIMKNPKRV